MTSRPIESLQARATTTRVSRKYAERPARPPSSEPPRELPAARLRAVSSQATSSAIAGPSARETSRQGALRPPSAEQGPSTMQGTNRQKDIPHPPVPTTMQGPQRLGTVLMKSQDEKPRVIGGARRVLIPTAPLIETDDTPTMPTLSKTGPPSTKPALTSSLPQSLVSKRDSQTDRVTTKVHSTAPVRAASSAATATTRPSSRTGPRPVTILEHPTIKSTSSRPGRSRSTTIDVEQQTSGKQAAEPGRSSQQAVGQKKPVWGGRSSGKASKPVVKGLSIRPKPGGLKSSDTGKPAPEHTPLPLSPTVCPTAVPLPSSPACSPCQSPELEPPASGGLSAAVTGDDTNVAVDARPLSAPIEATPPRNVEFQESPSKTPITALLSSIQRGFLFTPSSPLSPPQAYVTEIIAHTYCPNSPTAHKDTACVSDSTMRQALEVMDVN